MKPAENPRRPEPSIKIKPSRGNRKHNRLPSNRRFLASITTTTVSPAIQSVIATGGVPPSHPKPAIIVPIISPASLQGNRGRKHQGSSAHRSRPSPSFAVDISSPSLSSSSSSNQDRVIDVVGKGNGGRKSGRRDKPSRSERPRGERTRHHERPGRNKDKLPKNDRQTDRGRVDRLDRARASPQQTERGRPDRVEKVRSGGSFNPGRLNRQDKSRTDWTRLDKSIRFKMPRSERPRPGRPEKPKATKKILRLERKKHKLEKRLMKEMEKARRKQS